MKRFLGTSSRNYCSPPESYCRYPRRSVPQKTCYRIFAVPLQVFRTPAVGTPGKWLWAPHGNLPQVFPKNLLQVPLKSCHEYSSEYHNEPSVTAWGVIEESWATELNSPPVIGGEGWGGRWKCHNMFTDLSVNSFWLSVPLGPARPNHRSLRFPFFSFPVFWAFVSWFHTIQTIAWFVWL